MKGNELQMEKLTAADVARMTGGRLVHGDALTECVGADVDSRRIKKDWIFFAVKGPQNDGHGFIDSAVANGASVIVIERPYETLSLFPEAEKAAFIEVISSERALGALALAYRKRFECPFVGVTGSVGKTTTKEMIYAVLSARYDVLKSEGNFNSETGLPLSLLNMDSKKGAAVLEMGMDAAGEIDYLTRIARPGVAVITNIGVSHIEALGSRKNILKAKLEIENGLGADGTMVLNADDDMLYPASGTLSLPVILYGIENKAAAYRAENVRRLEDGTAFRVVTPYGSFDAKISAFGNHNVLNALAAVVAGYLCGLETDEIIKGLASYKNEKMRQSIYSFEGVTIMEDCYNASPSSMKAAFDVMSERPESPKVALLGDMLELGPDSPKYHFDVGAAAAKVFDAVICYGENGKYISDGANSVKKGVSRHYADKNAAVKDVIDSMKRGGAVLFKASRGMRAEDCLAAFKEGWKK